jgi:hypothetical protein
MEEEILLNEEQTQIIKKLKAENESLKFQISEYSQIVQELTEKLVKYKEPTK